LPEFTIETTYRLPVFRHATYVADTSETACRLAIEDNDWSNQKENYDSSGETYVTGIWDGPEAAYRSTAVAVPPQFEATTQRLGVHFEVLHGLLKMMVSDVRAARLTPEEWLSRADWAIAKAEAILAGAGGPEEPSIPGPQP
jgi:hypothetical protein